MERDHLLLVLPTSKTDPFRKGTTISIAATNDEGCALRSLRNMSTVVPAPANTPLFNPGRPFIRELVVDEVKCGLRRLGYEGAY